MPLPNGRENSLAADMWPGIFFAAASAGISSASGRNPAHTLRRIARLNALP